MKLKVEKVTEVQAFQALKDEWNTLLENSASNTLTLTHEWLSTWWEIFGEGRELCILVARDDGKLVGMAPMLKRTVQHYGVLPFHRIEFLASGEEEADEICSEYLDFILLRGREGEVLESLLGYLCGKDSEWDEILLTNMAGDSVNLPLVKSFCETFGINLRQVHNEMSIFLPLTTSFEEVVKNVGVHFRRRIRQDRKTFAAYGGEFRLITCRRGFEQSFASLVELHQERWTARGDRGVFASDKFMRFHRAFAAKAIDKGWLRLYLALKEGRRSEEHT